MLKHDPDMMVDALRGQLHELYAIDIDKSIMWKARAHAKEKLFGTHAESFKKLRCYANMILLTNLESVAIINSELPAGNHESSSTPTLPVFKRIFICYDAVKKGFLQGCRPFFGLDGCHLKGPFKGVLLAAVGIDANLQFYPICYGIVETENQETWKWFIEHLKETIGASYNGHPWTVMSDRQKGVVDAVSLIPYAIQRFCARHIWENFKKRFCGTEYKKLFWKAANTANFNEFLNVMRDIKGINTEAHDWLMNIDIKHWSRCQFDHDAKDDVNTNNHTESFNGWLDRTRNQPPIQMLEDLRESHTQLMYTRHVTSSRYTGTLPPRVRSLINENSRRSRHCNVRRCGEYEFQVELIDFKRTVRLNESHCDCELWKCSGIPCVHALACINTVRASVEEYCDPFYSIQKWRNCYGGIIHLIPSQNLWPPYEGLDLQPPSVRPLPGRPKKRRRRAEGESAARPHVQSATKRCNFCNVMGHNRRTCPKATSAGLGHNNGASPRGEGRASGRGRGRRRASAPGRAVVVQEAV